MCTRILFFALVVLVTIDFCLMRRSTKRSVDYEDEFPATLEGFGYYFNNAGQLRDMKLDIPFRFEVRQGDQAYNQLHYEALGKIVEEHVFKLLEEEEELEKVQIPLDAVGQEPKSFIFKSKDMDKMEKLLILIHGSGVVRAGQWSRSLIINHSLESGSQIPYIRRAKEEGYGVIVLNTNQNVDAVCGKGTVRGSENPSDHFLYVWDKVIMPSEAKHIAIMAHSYGGVVVLDGLKTRPGEIMERVFAVAMSDSVHPVLMLDQLRRIATEWFKKNSRNWVSSSLPLNTPIDLTAQADCKRVSAGTKKHVETSWYAFKSAFNFIGKRLKKRLAKIEAEQAAEAADAVDASVLAAQVQSLDSPGKKGMETDKLNEASAGNMDLKMSEDSDKKLPIEHEESVEEINKVELNNDGESLSEFPRKESVEKMEL